MKVSAFDAPRPGLFCCTSEAARCMRRSLIGAGIVAFGFALLISGLGADRALGAEAVRPTLRSIVSVTSDLVTIGDFFDDAGSAAATPLFRAPDLGSTGAVSARQVMELARASGFVDADSRGLTEVSVSRLSRPVEADEMSRLIAAAALRQPGRLSSEITLEDLRVVFDGTVEPRQADLRSADPVRLLSLSVTPQNGRFDALLGIDKGDSTERLHLRGEIVETAAVTVFTRDMNRGELIGRDDVRVERVPRRQLGASRTIDQDAVVGQAARRQLRAGQAAGPSDVVRPQMVGRGDTVTIVYETGALVLTTRGQALAAGTLGDFVAVLNPQSKRTVHAIVTAPGKVTVSGSGAAVASLQR